MGLRLTGKTITDPLYGNITLTELESGLVSTRAFQRLHNVRQLGLGHLVFPSAGYSRFAHSVGACHNADRILTAIETNQASRRFSDEERQGFRIAALFHDLGHYPFSHTTEHAVKRFYRDELYNKSEHSLQGSLEIEDLKVIPTYLDHEDTGKYIFLNDPEIAEVFSTVSSISKDAVTNSYLDEKLSTIISSDLDCDRLDYLGRTALHSGAPYGAVDVDFIISKSTIDLSGRFCFGRKAVRAADHLLVSRFYDFMQIPYHKTVAALEWSLEEAVIYLLQQGALRLSESDILEMLRDGSWASFDDGAMIAVMRHQLNEPDTDDLARDHMTAVLNRRPAKMVSNWECLLPFSVDSQTVNEELLEYKVADVSRQLGLDQRRFKIWKAPFKLSKAGPILQGSPSDRDYSDEEQQQLIHILVKEATDSLPLIDHQNAVAHHLAQLRYKVLRVYYLPAQNDKPSIKHDIRQALDQASA